MLCKYTGPAGGSGFNHTALLHYYAQRQVLMKKQIQYKKHALFNNILLWMKGLALVRTSAHDRRVL